MNIIHQNATPKWSRRILPLPCSITTVALLSCLVLPELAAAVGSETKWPWIKQDLVQRCANYSREVPRGAFCGPMIDCILDRTTETVKANFASGTSILSVLPTAIVLLAGQIEDVLTVARRDPFFGFLMAWSTGGAKGIVPAGRIAEIDAGSWWTEQELHHTANAVVLAGLIHAPSADETFGQAKMRFITHELHTLQRQSNQYENMGSAKRRAFRLLGNFLRLASAAATGTVFWVYFHYQETSCVTWFFGPVQFLAFFLSIWPPLADYLGTPFTEYREYWTIESKFPVCYVSGRPPRSARGAQKKALQRQQRMSFVQSMIPWLLVGRDNRPMLVLVWKSDNVKGEAIRVFVIFLRMFVYLWATVTLSSLTMVPARHGTVWFMSAVALVVYNRIVLLVLDSIPGHMVQMAEFTVR